MFMHQTPFAQKDAIRLTLLGSYRNNLETTIRMSDIQAYYFLFLFLSIMYWKHFNILVRYSWLYVFYFINLDKGLSHEKNDIGCCCIINNAVSCYYCSCCLCSNSCSRGYNCPSLQRLQRL